jgi:mRNA interferase RelE/StbE
MTHDVQWHREVRRQLRRLPRQVAEQVVSQVAELGAEPRPHGTEKLSGFERVWRIRIGQYRVLYQIVESQRVVYIVRVVKRSEAYERPEDLRRRLMPEV